MENKVLKSLRSWSCFLILSTCIAIPPATQAEYYLSYYGQEEMDCFAPPPPCMMRKACCCHRHHPRHRCHRRPRPPRCHHRFRPTRCCERLIHGGYSIRVRNSCSVCPCSGPIWIEPDPYTETYISEDWYYDPDRATADDNTWVNPGMDIDY